MCVSVHHQKRRGWYNNAGIHFLENIFLATNKSKQAELFSRVALSLQRRGY